MVTNLSDPAPPFFEYPFVRSFFSLFSKGQQHNRIRQIDLDFVAGDVPRRPNFRYIFALRLTLFDRRRIISRSLNRCDVSSRPIQNIELHNYL